MLTIKSKREIELMKKAGSIVELVLENVHKAIKPGVSTLELDRIAYKTIIENDAIPSFLNYNGFPNTICASINETVIHGIPKNNMILKDGDIISIDVGASYKGYHGDAARTFPCGNVSSEKLKLIEVTKQSLYEGLKFAKLGNRLSDISHAIETYAKSFGYGVVEEYTGHGIGLRLHEEPFIPNFGLPGHGPILKEGMTLAIEPMITLGKKDVEVLNDNWTVQTVDKLPAAHYEQSIVIIDKGYEILTKI